MIKAEHPWPWPNYYGLDPIASLSNHWSLSSGEWSKMLHCFMCALQIYKRFYDWHFLDTFSWFVLLTWLQKFLIIYLIFICLLYMLFIVYIDPFWLLSSLLINIPFGCIHSLFCVRYHFVMRVYTPSINGNFSEGYLATLFPPKEYANKYILYAEIFWLFNISELFWYIHSIILLSFL